MAFGVSVENGGPATSATQKTNTEKLKINEMNYFECALWMFQRFFPIRFFVVVIGTEKPKHDRVRRQIPKRNRGTKQEKKTNKITYRNEGLVRVMAKVRKTTINDVHAIVAAITADTFHICFLIATACKKLKIARRMKRRRWRRRNWKIHGFTPFAKKHIYLFSRWREI